MFIVCPKCFFKRTVDSKQIPPAATMATCPRCEEKFRFRDPETGEFIEKICLEFEDEVRLEKSFEKKEVTHDTVTSSALAAQSKPIQEQDSFDTTTTGMSDEIANTQASADMEVNTDMERTTNNTLDYEPIADEILGDALKSKTENENVDRFDKQETHSVSKLEDTSDEKPLLEEEVAKLQENTEENPLLDTYFEEEGDRDKKKKSQKYQMVSDDVPWEHPERYGIFGSLFQTMARVMFRAPEFFSTIHSQSSALRPALFYALLGLFQALCLQMWVSTLEAQIVEIAPQMQESLSAMSTPLAIMLAPFQAIFQLVLYSAFLYLAIRITNPDKADFNLILRVTAYAYAPTVLCIVPYIGPMVGLIWFVVNIVIGIRYALRLSLQKTLLALSPIFILLLFIMSNVISMFSV